MNILVCDDDFSIANSIAEYIKNKFKHEVFVSINREEALNVIHSENIDLLIIDIVLKDDNGILLAEDIQKNQSNIKIIFITGYGNVYYENIYEHIAPQGFLEKPIQYNILNFFIKQAESEYKKKTAKLKMDKAHLMGKSSYAELNLMDQMAKKPENALKLLSQLANPAVAQAKKESDDIQKLIDEQKGGFSVEPWDWNFYAEQVRKAKYDLDENQIKPYFEVSTVLEKGVFYAAEKFYGITFKERKDLPVYHPDVVAYEVFDRDGKSLAIYYLDFYTRDNKNGGAWMSNFVEQSFTTNTKPVIVNVFNYQKPAPGKPSLISYDDVSTMFHEFGHTLHGLFANQKYTTISGTNVPRDFVEFPSQIN